MNFLSKMNVAVMSALSLGVGSLFFMRNNQQNEPVEDASSAGEGEVKAENEGGSTRDAPPLPREKVREIMMAIRTRMQYYQRLAIKVYRDTAQFDEDEREQRRQEFFEKFQENDFLLVAKDICTFEFGVMFSEFTSCVLYFAESGDKEIAELHEGIESDFMTPLMTGVKVLPALDEAIIQSVSKSNAKEIYKEICCFKFSRVAEKARKYLTETGGKQLLRDDSKEFVATFSMIRAEVQEKLKEFLHGTEIINRQEDKDVESKLFEVLVRYCEDDLDLSGFIREIEVQAILLYQKILSLPTEIDYSYVKSIFAGIR